MDQSNIRMLHAAKQAADVLPPGVDLLTREIGQQIKGMIEDGGAWMEGVSRSRSPVELLMAQQAYLTRYLFRVTSLSTSLWQTWSIMLTDRSYAAPAPAPMAAGASGLPLVPPTE